jgi:dUTP pyrophosphatase
MKLNIRKLNPNAKLPKYEHGLIELYSASGDTIDIGLRKTIGTGIAVDIPYGYTGIIVGNYSLNAKYGIQVEPSVVFNMVKGEIKICMRSPYTTFILNQGTHIANLILFKVEDIEIEVV